MSIWHPRSGITYMEYLQANSFVGDITRQVKSSGKHLETTVSDLTKEIVASNQQLTEEFRDGYDSINSTLEWGFNKIEDAVKDVNSSILSLRADFNYSMGLLLEQAHIQNSLLASLIGKLDEIHKTIESPTLTQAREFYNIGCERLSKGLLDKALEAFVKAEKNNDTDVFTQFHLGKLYLYGVDEDDNVLDLQKAREHLLLAARYAKAEMAADPTFSQIAAEALLHASISIYALLGEEGVRDNAAAKTELLKSARLLACDSVKLCPMLTESLYHAAKYSSLLNDREIAISYLDAAISASRDYAVKVDIDRAFDPVRSEIFALISKKLGEKKIESQQKYERVIILLKGLSEWHLEESQLLSPMLATCNEELSRAKGHMSSQTYFGYLDAVALLERAIDRSEQLQSQRIDELRRPTNQILQDMLLPMGSFSPKTEDVIQEAKSLIQQAESHLCQDNYKSLKSAYTYALSAISKAEYARRLAHEENSDTERQRRRNSASKEYAISCGKAGGIIGAILFGISGCNGCLKYCESHSYSGLDLFLGGGQNLFTGLFYGAIGGALVGAVIGVLIGQREQ